MTATNGAHRVVDIEVLEARSIDSEVKVHKAPRVWRVHAVIDVFGVYGTFRK